MYFIFIQNPFVSDSSSSHWHIVRLELPELCFYSTVFILSYLIRRLKYLCVLTKLWNKIQYLYVFFIILVVPNKLAEFAHLPFQYWGKPEETTHWNHKHMPHPWIVQTLTKVLWHTLFLFYRMCAHIIFRGCIQACYILMTLYNWLNFIHFFKNWKVNWLYEVFQRKFRRWYKQYFATPQGGTYELTSTTGLENN